MFDVGGDFVALVLRGADAGESFAVRGEDVLIEAVEEAGECC